jgi:hypothetical protein
MICVAQIESRSGDSLSPEHPYRVVLSRSGGPPYYLSRVDYFWCQQLGLYSVYCLTVSGIFSGTLRYWLLRRRRV